jgi:hypothetical protein
MVLSSGPCGPPGLLAVPSGFPSVLAGDPAAVPPCGGSAVPSRVPSGPLAQPLQSLGARRILRTGRGPSR